MADETLTFSRNNDRLIELTSKWYRFIGGDHHKDRDCHWYIERVWSYGEEPYFRASHNGYILGDWTSPKCGTYELAELLMLNFLERAIEEHLDSTKELILYMEQNPDEMSWHSMEELQEQLRILS